MSHSPKTVTTATQHYRVEAIVRTQVGNYLAIDMPTGDAKRIEFSGIPPMPTNGQYPEPRHIVASRPYVIEFL